MCGILDFVVDVIDLCFSFVMNILMFCALIIVFILMWVLYLLSGFGTIGGMQQPVYGNGFEHKTRYVRTGGGGAPSGAENV